MLHPLNESVVYETVADGIQNVRVYPLGIRAGIGDFLFQGARIADPVGSYDPYEASSCDSLSGGPFNQRYRPFYI